MSKIKIPGVSFSLNRSLGITQAKQKFVVKQVSQPQRLDWKEKWERWCWTPSSEKENDFI